MSKDSSNITAPSQDTITSILRIVVVAGSAILSVLEAAAQAKKSNS